MKLKRIKAFGFKTFAEPTTVEFSGGITAIVGPNGSGKSNLVDAIRWVLGETSTRSLRSGKLEDVIFAGNDKRKPLGLAEVCVTFDNSDRALPIDYGEVEITRRAYRAGESEYFINRSQVRLRDIHDLLMGTGLGPGSYAIVSQGQIDAVLTSKPTERRALFEETAGISKFIARKHESMRRLEQTESNAIRISDLIAETERRIPELDGQVRRARRYRRVQTRVRDLEILSYLRASASRRAEREQLRQALKGNDERRAVAAAHVATLGADLAQTRTQLYRQELQLEEFRTQAQSRRAELAHMEAEYAAALARREALEGQSTQTSHDVERVAQERASLETAIAALDEQLKPLEQQISSARERELAAQAAVAHARGRLDAIFTQLRAVESDAADRAARRAERRVQIENLHAEAERFEGELRAAREHAAVLELSEGTATQQYAHAGHRLDGLEAQAAQARDALASAEREAAQAHDDLVRAQSAHREHAGEVTAAESRLHTIEELENALEGHVPGTRAVVEAWQRGELSGIEGVVSNLVTIDERYAHAIDMAFGMRVSNIVTRTGADAERAIEYLNRSESGRATLMPLDALPSRERRAPAADITRDPGVLGYAPGLIRTAAKYAPMVEFLVGDVLIVDTLHTAVRLVRERGVRETIVTLSGEMIAGGVAITGGRFKRERSILSRRAQAVQLREQLTEMHARLASFDARLRTEQARSDAAHAKRDAVREALAKLELRLAEVRAEMAARGAEVERMHAEVEAARRTADDLIEGARQSREREQTYDAQEPGTERADEERHRLEAELARVREEIVHAEEAQSRQSAAASGVREGVASLGAQRNAATARLAMLDQDDERARLAREQMLAQIASLVEQTRTAHARVEGLRHGVSETDAQLERARRERESLADRQTSLESELRTAELEEREVGAEGETRHTRLTQIEAELGMIVSQFSQNPATDGECRDVEDRYAQEPDAVVDDVPRLRDELARLSANVNLNAEAEREETAERERFLRTQLDDLARARETLLQSIKEIELQTQAQFNETFDRVAREFSAVYARLFEGGTARIWQTNPENLSETGIEIAVQPPGKKQMPLPALSGGEQAMTAAALIFALIRVSPSPFYLLDEVDAALDDVNVERFSAMVRELAGDSEMILVTHNKKTMELANRMYGVTMTESGISSIISAELTARRPEPAIA
ncbi:MAG TPA: chromosome segregation protein SMC [Candidatus Tyrphobacter sp.]